MSLDSPCFRWVLYGSLVSAFCHFGSTEDEVYVYTSSASGNIQFLNCKWLLYQLSMALITVGPGSFAFESFRTNFGNVLK